MLLNKHHIFVVEEIEHKKIDKWLGDCASLDIQGVNDETTAFLEGKRQKLAFYKTAQQAHNLRGEPEEVKDADPMLAKLKVEFVGLIETGTIQSAEEFAKGFKENSHVVEYVAILEHLAVFKRIEKNHFHVVQTAKTKISMLASVLKVVEENSVSPEDW